MPPKCLPSGSVPLRPSHPPHPPPLVQALLPQMPHSLRQALPAVARQPLRLALERLLRRPATEAWLEAVLAAYTAAVMLPSPPVQQVAAEKALLDALAGLQHAAAAHGVLHAAAQQAVHHAAARLRLYAGGGGCDDSREDGRAARLGAAERQQLLAEALQHLTSPASLEVAAAAQLAAQQHPPAGRDAEEQRGSPLASLLHSPPTRLEVQLLCLVVLLPGWEVTLRRLAGLEPGGESLSCGGECGSARAAQQAVQLLCGACASQPDAVLAQHPALLAEVCRESFRFTACFAPLLGEDLRAAAADTETAAEAARWRAAHATKHVDHVTDYLLAKGCSPQTAAQLPAMPA